MRDELVEEEVDEDEDEEEDELDGLVMDQENRLVGVIGLGTKTFSDVGEETAAERAPSLVGLVVFLVFSSSLLMLLFCLLWV